MSRMMTMRPSPRIVAPAIPRIPEICGPSDFTTISRLPTSSSVTREVECSPARISTTDIEMSDSGRRVESRPRQKPRDDIPGQAPHTFHRGERKGIGFLGNAHDQGLADCQREGQADRKPRSLARSRVYEQAAAELLYFGCHDVH